MKNSRILRFLSSSSSVRFASTLPNLKPFLPSVSWLIEKNHLNAEIVSKIPTSGPKNNLLKGDVLRFLEQGGSLQNIDEILGNENYYQLDLKALDKEWLAVLKKSALMKKLTSMECTITKIAKNNEYSRSVDLASKSTTAKPFDSIKAGFFRFVDCLALGPLEEAPTFHTTSGEAAVLSIHQLGSLPIERDLDFLIGPSSSVAHFFKPQSKEKSLDLLDELISTASTPKLVRLELTVDGRIVDERTATQFLSQIQDLVG